MDKTTIGNRIRDERLRLGLTLAELGDKIGVSKQCLSGWEHGRNMPDVFSLNSIADICGLEIKDFLTNVSTKRVKQAAKKFDAVELTEKEMQIINKLRTMNADRRKAFEVLLGVREKH